MSKTTLILVRHGATVWNLERRYQGHQDSPLTARGRQQVQALAERLHYEPLATIYSSDLGRCQQTAQPVAAMHGQAVILDERLRERNVGLFEGLTKAEVQEKYPAVLQAQRSAGPDFVIPQGESIKQVLQRSLSCLEDLARQHERAQILVLSHGSLISVFMRHVLGIPLDGPRRFRIRNAGLNIILFDQGQWMVETLNDVSHLGRLKAMDDKT